MTSDKECFDVLRPRGYEQFIFAFEQTTQNDATFARAFELVDAKEFDQLVDHLHTHGAKAYVDDGRLIYRVVAACGMCAFDIISLLVKAGADKFEILRMAVVYGHVDLLQVAHERGYQHSEQPDKEFGMSDLLFYAPDGDETNALKVLRWSLEVRYTYLARLQYTFKEDFTAALRSMLEKDYIDAAACLLDNYEDFGPSELAYTCDGSPEEYKRDHIEYAANRGAVRSLDFLCQRWGVEFVTNTIRKAEIHYKHEDEIRRWLRKRKAYKNVM